MRQAAYGLDDVCVDLETAGRVTGRSRASSPAALGCGVLENGATCIISQCRPTGRDAITGDLIEERAELAAVQGERSADRWMRQQILRSVADTVGSR